MILKVLICAVFVNFAYGQICDSHQKCIAEKQCGPDGKVRTDGAGLLGVRFNVIQPCGINKVCCQFEAPDAIDYGDIFKTPKCGVRGSGSKSRIMFESHENSEDESYFGEFPWMVIILKKNKSGARRFCGGSLIRANVVLSSTHNLLNEIADDLIAKAGDWDLVEANEQEKYQEKEVISIIMHEDFIKKTLANDIALLFLDESFTLSSHINVICLPSKNTLFDGESCTVSGWGKPTFDGNGIEANILKKVDLPIIPYKKCNKMLKRTRLGRRFQLHSSFICAGGELNKDSCTGDGGSPLICPIPGTNDEYYQAGIVSWGIGCGRENVPGAYTNVAMFSEWIEDQVQENEIFNP